MTHTGSQTAEVEVTRSMPYEASHKQGQTMSDSSSSSQSPRSQTKMMIQSLRKRKLMEWEIYTM